MANRTVAIILSILAALAALAVSLVLTEVIAYFVAIKGCYRASDPSSGDGAAWSFIFGQVLIIPVALVIGGRAALFAYRRAYAKLRGSATVTKTQG